MGGKGEDGVPLVPFWVLKAGPQAVEHWTNTTLKDIYLFICFFKKDLIFFREGEREGERQGEKHGCV